MLDQKKFSQALPAFYPSVMEILLRRGFVPLLVGGAVRDYFLYGVLGKDWDVELTHRTLSWNQDLWKDLGRDLQALGKVAYLPYDVIRLELKDHQLEFSPPRVETFSEENHHKNFSVCFDFSLPFSDAVKRRDFTINAMGIELSKAPTLLDPLEGQRHLAQSTLHYCSQDFSKDPVRFLRAHRFKVKYNMSFSGELEEVLKSMDPSPASSTYFWSEMQKSGNPALFLKSLLEAQVQKLPVDESFLGKLPELLRVLQDPSRHESWMIALEWVGLSSTQWQTFFHLSSESARRFAKWVKTSRNFEHLKPEVFHGEFEASLARKEFDELFDWYFSTKQLLQKYPELPLLKMIESHLPDWIHLYRFEPLKDVKHIDPPLRAKYQVWNLCQRL